jgi:hypothetical protein
MEKGCWQALFLGVNLKLSMAVRRANNMAFQEYEQARSLNQQLFFNAAKESLMYNKAG